MVDPAISVTRYVEEDRRNAFQYRLLSRTKRSWKFDLRTWSQFSNFLGSLDPWLACPEDIAAWCAHRADNGISPRTIESEISSLNFVYEKLGKGHFLGKTGQATVTPSPARNSIVRETVKGIWALHSACTLPQKPISLELLESMIDIQNDDLSGIRNRALLALGWSGARRVKEIIWLDLGPRTGGSGYIEFKRDGFVIVLNRSKSRESSSSPELYGIPKRYSAPRYCPFNLVKKWMDAGQISGDALFPALRHNHVRPGFRTSSNAIASIIRDSIKTVGLNPAEYGARSLRIGCISWLISQGVHPSRVIEHTGQRGIPTMMKYLRNSSGIVDSPLADTSWVK